MSNSNWLEHYRKIENESLDGWSSNKVNFAVVNFIESVQTYRHLEDHRLKILSFYYTIYIAVFGYIFSFIEGDLLQGIEKNFSFINFVFFMVTIIGVVSYIMIVRFNAAMVGHVNVMVSTRKIIFGEDYSTLFGNHFRPQDHLPRSLMTFFMKALGISSTNEIVRVAVGLPITFIGIVGAYGNYHFFYRTGGVSNEEFFNVAICGVYFLLSLLVSMEMIAFKGAKEYSQ